MISTAPFTSIPLDPVLSRGRAHRQWQPLETNLRTRFGRLESVCTPQLRVIATTKEENFHPLIAAADLAFRDHYPLRLSPDILWLPMAQSIARHIMINAESLRARLVQHSGSELIQIIRDEFRLGRRENDWAGCLEEFGAELEARANPEVARILSAAFSTTTRVEYVASQAVLMEALSAYFHYEVLTRCGIPEIQLEGTVDDYVRIGAKLESALVLFPELDFWVPIALKIVRQARSAVAGEIDREFWSDIYKRRQASGGDRITGWLKALFAYTKLPAHGAQPLGFERNPELTGKAADPMRGLMYSQLPDAISCIPFIWNYFKRLMPYEFLAGLGAIAQDPDSAAIRPVTIWAVRPAAA